MLKWNCSIFPRRKKWNERICHNPKWMTLTLILKIKLFLKSTSYAFPRNSTSSSALYDVEDSEVIQQSFNVRPFPWKTWAKMWTTDVVADHSRQQAILRKFTLQGQLAERFIWCPEQSQVQIFANTEPVTSAVNNLADSINVVTDAIKMEWNIAKMNSTNV